MIDKHLIKDYKKNLTKGAKSVLFEFAKQMRKAPTNAERILWGKLRRGTLGHKFRRQHPIGNFIADFYCSKKRLAIELDGSIHGSPEVKLRDACRTEYLKEFDIQVLRFPNHLVENNIEEVIAVISRRLDSMR